MPTRLQTQAASNVVPDRAVEPLLPVADRLSFFFVFSSGPPVHWQLFGVIGRRCAILGLQGPLKVDSRRRRHGMGRTAPIALPNCALF